MSVFRLLALCLPLHAWAAEPPDLQSSLQIEDSGLNSTGLLSVNAAAGLDHQQLNARAIAIGQQVLTRLELLQKLELGPVDLKQDAQVEILGASFSGGNGLTGVNQAAGVGNQQINAFRMGLGSQRQDLDDSVLSQQNVIAPANLSGSAGQPKGNRMVVTDDQTFAGSRGVVQLNQSAGVGNRSVNSLSLNVVD